MEIDWNIIWSAVTAISTLIMTLATIAMAIFASCALNVWKKEQKRAKLVKLLETFNSFIQDLQYYELESGVFSKNTRGLYEHDLKNINLISQQVHLIDSEMAEAYGNCVLCIKNWLIDDDRKYDELNDLNKSLQEYRIKIFEYVKQKVSFYIEFNSSAEVLYDNKIKKLRQISSNKVELENKRENIFKKIEYFKKDYKALLK